MKNGLRLAVGAVVTGIVLAGCGGGSDTTLTVFAASSLTDAFTDLAEEFEAANSGSSVRLNFGSSSVLATQINEGAPADVFASADTIQMAVVRTAGNAAEPTTFARNELVIIASAEDERVATLADLAKDDLRLVLAAPDVPVGRYAREMLENASAPSGGIAPGLAQRVLANVRSGEANVRAVLSKVQLGEADAGIVYATDAAIAGPEIRVISIPGEYNVVAEYPIARVTDSTEADLADAFIAFVLSDRGQAILRHYGFAAP